MTAITKLKGTALYIKIGNAASPEVFTHPCLINTKRGIKFTSKTNEVIIPDCDNPDDPAWTTAIKDGLKATIDGAGMIDNVLATIQFYDLWYRDPDPKNVQVWLGTVGRWPGAFHLTNWDITGERNNYAEVSLTLESDGALGLFAAS